jgi:hypothetical protein
VIDVIDLIRRLEEDTPDLYQSVTARTPHGTYRFSIDDVEVAEDGSAVLVLKEIPK